MRTPKYDNYYFDDHKNVVGIAIAAHIVLLANFSGPLLFLMRACTGKHHSSVAILSLVPAALVQYSNRLVIFPSTR